MVCVILRYCVNAASAARRGNDKRTSLSQKNGLFISVVSELSRMLLLELAFVVKRYEANTETTVWDLALRTCVLVPIKK